MFARLRTKKTVNPITDITSISVTTVKLFKSIKIGRKDR